MTSIRNLEIESQAVAILREGLQKILAENALDDEFLLDIIEGQTNLLECLNAAAEQLIADQGLIAGIDSIGRALKARADRITHRIDVLREAVRAAMERADIKTHQAPAGTFTRMMTPLKTVIVDEKIIPAQFWKQPAPVLDKRALLEALKDGEVIDGAALSNRSETLQFRSG